MRKMSRRFYVRRARSDLKCGGQPLLLLARLNRITPDWVSRRPGIPLPWLRFPLSHPVIDKIGLSKTLEQNKIQEEAV